MTESISTMLLTASSEVSIIRFPISTSTGSSGLGEIKIRYLETRRLADGSDETGDAGASDDELRSLSGHKDRR